MDSSIDSGPESPDADDLPVDIGTLELDGTRPEVGDKVDIKVGGTITKIVNKTAFVSPETCNDQPMPPRDMATESEDMKAMATEAGPIGY
jgi:hypothetical protein